MTFTKEDYANLQRLMNRVSYNGLDEAKTAVVLEAKLIQAAKELDGNVDSASSDKPSTEQPAEQQ